MRFVDKDLLSMQEARVLMEAAKNAQNNLKGYTQERLDRIVSAMLDVLDNYAEQLVEQEISETGCGNFRDNLRLVQLFFNKIKPDLEQPLVGPLSTNKDGKVTVMGIPVGGVVGFLPAMNVVLNTIYMILLAIKSGNSLLLIPDACATETTKTIAQLLSEAGVRHGLPKETILCMENVERAGIAEVLQYNQLGIVLSVGNSDCLKEYYSAKPIIYAGVTPSPSFIERTAHISQTVTTIVKSRQWNNGTLPGAEQYIVAEQVIVAQIIEALQHEKAYVMNVEEEHKLMDYICPVDKACSHEYIGKNAYELAKRSGFSVPQDTSVLVCKQAYINDEYAYAKPLYCPLLVLYEEPNWLKSCEKCIELIQNGSQSHTLSIHSNDTFIIGEFIDKKPVGRVIVNNSTSFASMGLTSELTPSVFLGGLTTGRGFVSDNITAKYLTYERKVGYGTFEKMLGNPDSREQENDIDKILSIVNQLKL